MNPPAAAAIARLPHLGVLRFSGPDALVFLQGQVSNDTRRLAAGEPLLASYSSPQGRVEAIVRLLPHSTGVLAVLPRDVALPTLERLRKYVLRAKVQLEDLSDRFTVAGALHDPGGLGPSYSEHGGVAHAPVTAGAERRWCVGMTEDLVRQGMFDPEAPTETAEAAWRLADIRAGLPQVYAATREMFVAQMLNLDLIDGISFAKGCFTGQEIIARTQHLGRIKRRLLRLALPAGTWAIGQAVRLADGRSGRITECARAESGGFEALAVLSVASGGAENEGGESGGDAHPPVEARQLPLPYEVRP